MSCLAITSPQTELAVAQEKFVKESMKPDEGEWLGEYICCLILGAEISKREVFEKNLFLNTVIIDFSILCPGVKNWICGDS